MRPRPRKSRLIKSAGSALIVPATRATIACESRAVRAESIRDTADEALAIVAGAAGDTDYCHLFAGAKAFVLIFRRGAVRAVWQPKLHRELATA